MKLAKHQAKDKQHTGAEPFLLKKFICYLHPHYHPKILEYVAKKAYLFKGVYMINDNENKNG